MSVRHSNKKSDAAPSELVAHALWLSKSLRVIELVFDEEGSASQSLNRAIDPELAFLVIRGWPSWTLRVDPGPNEEFGKGFFFWTCQRSAASRDPDLQVAFLAPARTVVEASMAAVNASHAEGATWSEKGMSGAQAHRRKIQEHEALVASRIARDAADAREKAEAEAREQRKLEKLWPPVPPTFEHRAWLTSRAGENFRVSRVDKSAPKRLRKEDCITGRTIDARLRDADLILSRYEEDESYRGTQDEFVVVSLSFNMHDGALPVVEYTYVSPRYGALLSDREVDALKKIRDPKTPKLSIKDRPDTI